MELLGGNSKVICLALNLPLSTQQLGKNKSERKHPEQKFIAELGINCFISFIGFFFYKI